MGGNDEIAGAVKGGVTRRHFLEMSGGLLLAPYAARAATATAALHRRSPAGPAGSVRFLTAENFWADWSPYASTALSQLRLERQVYDYLVDFPSGDLAQPEPMLATAWRAGRRSHVGVRAARRRDVPRRRAVHRRRRQGIVGVGHRVQRRECLRDQLGARRGRGRRPPHGCGCRPSSRSDRCLSPSAGTRRSCPQHGSAETPISWRPSRTAPARSASSRTTVEIKTMEANLDYWRDPAKIGTLVWEFIQDPQTRLNALLDGSAQAIDRVPPEHLPLLEERG